MQYMNTYFSDDYSKLWSVAFTCNDIFSGFLVLAVTPQLGLCEKAKEFETKKTGWTVASQDNILSVEVKRR